MSEEDIGDAVTGLAAGKPRGEHGIGLLENPGNHERPTREQQRHHRPAQCPRSLEYCPSELRLMPRQTEFRATGRLAAHHRRLAQTKHDDLGMLDQRHGWRDATHILTLDIDARRMGHGWRSKRFAQSGEDADLPRLCGRCPPRAAHVGRGVGKRTDQGQPMRRRG